MSDRSNIEWTDATWNPVTGCTKVSPGCDHCYAETLAERFRGTEGHYYEQGFDVTLRPEKLDQPLRWKRPRLVFVNSMSDLFHDDVPDHYIVEVFARMLLAQDHTFQLLTKRHGRMRSLLTRERYIEGPSGPLSFQDAVRNVAHNHRNNLGTGGVNGLTVRGLPIADDVPWPLPNVWLGVSVEDQKRADLRVPALLDTPAAVRFLSCEPLLGPVDLTGDLVTRGGAEYVDWVIVGGESGRGARPMHPEWARALRDQCQTAGVPFHFKQWGEWAPRGRLRDGEPLPVDNERTIILNAPHGNTRGRAAGSLTNRLCEFSDGSHCEVLERVGKRSAGRLLDGRTYDDMPTNTTENGHRP